MGEKGNGGMSGKDHRGKGNGGKGERGKRGTGKGEEEVMSDETGVWC
jgi:hypothetical protein